MTETEANKVVEWVLNGWPHSGSQAWTEGEMRAFRDAVLDLDAGLCFTAVGRMVKTLKWRPSVAELREHVRAIARERENDERAAQREQDWRRAPLAKPEWVERWDRARAAGDQRPFPEQASALGPDKPAVPFDDPDGWVQPSEYRT